MRSPGVISRIQALPQLLEDLRVKGDFWQDYSRTRREASFIRRCEFPAPGEKLVLLTMLTFSAFEVKVFAMLALALRLRGWRAKVLLQSPDDRWPHRYFRAFGLDDFVYWNDFPLTREEKESCRGDAEGFMSGELDFRTIKGWKYRGCWIGPQILAAVARGAYEGSPDVSKPEVRKRIFKMLPGTLRTVLISEKVLGQVQPTLMYLIEANYPKSGALTDVAVQRGIDFIQIGGSGRDDVLMFRRLTPETRRQHPASVSKETLERALQEPWTEREEQELADTFTAMYDGRWVIQSRVSPGIESCQRDKLCARLQLDPAKKIVAVFSHVLWDANLFYGEDLFQDYGDWFVQTARAAAANDRVNWLIKLHPANNWVRERENWTSELAELALLREHLGELPPHVHLLFPEFQISTRALFEIIDCAVTVRGTVSTEAPCFGVPAFTAGTGRSAQLGFTIDSSTREEYLARMASIQDYQRLPEDVVRRARRHAHIAFRRRPWVMKSIAPLFFQRGPASHPLYRNLRIAARSLDEIHVNGDLDRFAEWAADRSRIDFLGD